MAYWGKLTATLEVKFICYINLENKNQKSVDKNINMRYYLIVNIWKIKTKTYKLKTKEVFNFEYT